MIWSGNISSSVLYFIINNFLTFNNLNEEFMLCSIDADKRMQHHCANSFHREIFPFPRLTRAVCLSRYERSTKIWAHYTNQTLKLRASVSNKPHWCAVSSLSKFIIPDETISWDICSSRTTSLLSVNSQQICFMRIIKSIFGDFILMLFETQNLSWRLRIS